MYRFIALAAIAVASIVLPSTAQAERHVGVVTESDDQLQGSRCYATTYEWATERTLPSGVWTDDFVLVQHWTTLNVGTTKYAFLPCIPTACPDPYELASGNVCRLSASLPQSEPMTFQHRYGPAATEAPAKTDLIDVGPLVEPSLAR